jgi:hypothetical protein
MRDFILIVTESQEPLDRDDLLETVIDEAAIPATEYGYWVTDKGEIVPVDYMHSMTVAEMGLPSIERAMRDGWIRIVSQGQFFIQMYAGCPTRRAVSALRRLLMKADYQFYNCDIDYDVACQRLLDISDERKEELYKLSKNTAYSDKRELFTAIEAIQRA